MKKLCLVVSMAVALCATTAKAGYDGTISIGNRVAGTGSGPGGAFDITVTSGLGALTSSRFFTFCLENNEYINVPGSPYDVNLGPSAIKGGSGGPQPDPISIGTAWLYSQFRNGSLANYANIDASANALQAAIWWLEQEIADPGNGNVFRNDIIAKYGTVLAARADANGAYGVVVMNLFNGPGQNAGYNQSLLGVVPEPTTMIAGALLLLPFGASTIRILRRKNQSA